MNRCSSCGTEWIGVHSCMGAVRPLNEQVERNLREFATRKAGEALSERLLRTKLASAGERLLREPFSPAAKRAMREAIDEVLRFEAETAAASLP
jgi:hypothetical protein